MLTIERREKIKEVLLAKKKCDGGGNGRTVWS